MLHGTFIRKSKRHKKTALRRFKTLDHSLVGLKIVAQPNDG